MVKIGIIGAGRIATSMARTVKGMEEAQCYAIASRDLQKAQEFAKEYDFEKAYGSYEELVQDEQVDIVYIATPHSHHFEHAKLCIEHGKHVLCEKAFTINTKQAEALFALAKEKKVLITEAIWTRYMPSRKIINDLLSEGIIGEVRTLTANLSYAIAQKERLIRPELAGGALLDVGVYTLNFALMHFGNDYQKMTSTVVMTETGVDGQECITLTYPDGKFAVLTAGMYGLSDRNGVFYGTKGYMVVENINNPQCIDVYNASHERIRHVVVPEQITGYEYQVQEMIECIREGKLECPSMPHEESLRVLRMMDELRKDWGVIYPQEK